jgi:tetratricopeptide (TPR) repeat protein
MQKPDTSSENEDRKKALVIGVSIYKNQVSHPFCEKNYLDMHNIFKSEGYEIHGQGKLVGDVKDELIRKETIDFFTNSKSEDLVVFYYSGQIFLNKQGSVYLGSSDINPALPFEGGISYNNLISYIERCPSKRIIIIMDCFIGTREKTINQMEDPDLEIASSDIKKKYNRLRKSGKILLACIQSNKEAYAELKEGNSIFTYYLSLGLQLNDKSKEPARKITAETLGNFVFQQLRNLPKEKRPSQIPIIMTQSPNDIIIVNQNKQSINESQKFENISSLLEYGNTYFSKNDFEKASISYDKAITLDKNNGIAWYKKANALSELGKYNEAIECYDEAIRLNPNNADAYNNKGTIFSELNNYDEAIECYDEAIAFTKNDDIIYYNKANALSELGKYDEAIECYDEAIRLNPNNADAYNNKDHALFKLLKSNEARKYRLNKRMAAMVGLFKNFLLRKN